MKFKTEEFRAANKIIDNVPVNAALDSSNYVRLSAVNGKLYLNLTSIMRGAATVSATDKPADKWVGFVDRKLLRQFLATATAPEIELTFKEKNIVFVSGQSLKIPTMAPVSGYESWKPTTPAVSFPTDIPWTLLTSYCASAQGMDYVKAICFIKGIGVLASNTVELVTLPDASNKLDMLISPAIAQIYAKNGGNLYSDKDGIGVVLSNGYLFMPTPPSLDKFPKALFSDLIGKILSNGKSIFKVSAGELKSILKAVEHFGDSMVVDINKSGFTATVDTAGGKFTRNLSITAASPLCLRWSVKGIMPWLSDIEENEETCYNRFDAGNGLMINTLNSASRILAFPDSVAP